MFAKNDIEPVLLEGAAAIKRGENLDPASIAKITKALDEFSPQTHHKLTPLVDSFLTVKNPWVQLHAALAIGRLKDSGSRYVPTLKELANQSDIPTYTSGACLSALGEIATPEAIDFLTTTIGTLSRPDWLYVLGALAQAGASADKAIGPLKELSRHPALSEKKRKEVTQTVAKIYQAIKYQHAEDIKAFDFFEYISILSSEFGEGQTAYQHFAPYSTPINYNQDGLIHQGRMRFAFSEPKNELGIRIFRGPEGGAVVVFETDSASYGVGPTSAIEHLATAAVHIFDLDPRNTTWVEYYGRSGGTANPICQTTKLDWNSREGLLSNPRWSIETSLYDVLRKQGIEV